MKNFHSILFIFCVLLLTSSGSVQNSDRFIIKDFYLGMKRTEVNKIYNLLKKNEVAQYISVEKENYRDLIKLDNEFSSMGNKIEIAYDENEKVQEITFQYKTVNILFDSEKLEAKDFVKKFQEEYKIDKMEYKDMGFVKSWIYIDKELKIKISIDDYKNLRLQKIKEE